MEKKYWQSIEELNGLEAATEKEASMMEILANETNDKASSRRDFLKWCGISFFSATVVSACENPVKKAIPYLHQPEELIPGQASWYASAFAQGNQYCGILVKTRDGRPIKIEGNTLCPITAGGTNAIVQASVLSLYDDGARYKQPTYQGETIAWDQADQAIRQALKEASEQGQKAFLVTPSLMSPSSRELILSLQKSYPALEWISWDAISYEALRQAHNLSFGANLIPDYRFDKAELIVSFSADFLGTWLAPLSFAPRYAQTRQLSENKKTMSRHIHFEAGMSLTGSNADERIPVKPSTELDILMALYNDMAALTGNPVISTAAVDYDTRALAQDILHHKGKTLVVCGHNNLQAQILVNAINHMAGAYGQTLDISRPLNLGHGHDAAMNKMLQEMQAGNAAVVMFYKANPLYNHPQAEAWEEALKKVPLSISFATAKDETARACQYILPDNHYLESWGELMPRQGNYALMQPAIQPLFNTRQFQASLLAWQEQDTDYHAYLKAYAQRSWYPQQRQHPDFQQFWVNTLQAGVWESPLAQAPELRLRTEAASDALSALKAAQVQAGELQFMVYEHIAMADGANANNPWLQELPDPLTKTTWDNFAAVSPRFAQEHQLKDGDIITLNGLQAPVLIQPGQAYQCISLALGYGREHAGKSGDHIGVNAFTLLNNKPFPWNVAQWAKTGKGHQFARTQTHHSMEGRDIIRESTLDKYREKPNAGNEIRDYHKKHMVTLYPEQEFPGHHWALMVDLNACTGCSSCVISCQAENNTPVIGKKEVMRRRIMHWMRIDRYYTGDTDNPGVLHQPLMCQHCDHAPCENVCPVSATTHSQEGINQITYNRCVGTKYCINNCPYKVRRFNWFEYAQNLKFDYHMNSDLGRMVLNPDVTVRERGVVEKCSFCVQRIQEAKLKAKNERRPLRDGDVVPACASACPSNALVFGDLNDKNSRVAQLIKDPRNYHLLEELHTLPSVGYLTRIRNKS